MEPVTYSLIHNEKDSEEYYGVIRKLTDEVLFKGENFLSKIIDDYISYLKKYGLEEIREREEYLLELLSFGILWKAYSRKALSIRVAPFITMSKMGEWRKKHQRLKPLIDFLRGVFITMFLLPRNSDYNQAMPTLAEVDRVCLWFEATGEFREQALRFITWRAYWETIDARQLRTVFSTIAEFRRWFEIRANDILGRYTANVERFRNSTRRKYWLREDRISCSRTRSEYHLNMVGAEMMNRAFRHEYSLTNSTALLLPGCMRAKSNQECEAIREKRGLKCTGCKPECRVNHLRIHGAKNKYEVYVIPHASDLTLWSAKKGEEKKGIVASACVTTLVEGGWELKRYGIPAQCVLLDYCGCKKHWHPTGIATRLNRKELERVIAKN